LVETSTFDWPSYKEKKIKGYAKSLETFNVFPILFPKFSFPYFYFYNHSRF
jgi:hypothetical protein